MKNIRFYLKPIVLLVLFCAVSSWAIAQNRIVTGTVKDTSGESVIGANVTEVGTTNGTITDLDGNFSLNVSPQGNITVSFIGYKSQTIAVGGRTVISVVLDEDSETLDEVVVVGYGVVKKRDLTGAITSVKSEQLMATAPTTIQEALRGKAAGVMVAGAGLNEDPMIRIRGNRSISASNEPLFVVDGIPSSSGMSVINPSDVASIEVLKDASATAIYGARGANGVILVTTKKGETGKVSVEYNGYLSVGKVDNYRKVLKPAEYMEYLREAERQYIYDGQGGYTIDPASNYPSMTPNWDYDQQLEYVGSQDLSGYVLESVRRAWEGGVYDPSKLRGFDWQGAGMRDQTISQNHTISVRGGSNDTKVFLSGSFMDNEGLTPRSFRKRYTLRLNLDQNIGKYVTIGATTNFAYWEYFNGTGVGGNWNPLGTPYYSPGGYGDYGVGGDVTVDGDPALGLVPHPTGEGMLWNPFYDFTGTEGKTKRNQIDATLYARVQLGNGLSYQANFGTNYYSGQEQMFWASASTSQGFGAARGEQKVTFERGWTFENILGYSKTFGQHSLNLTAVQSAQKLTKEPLEANGVGLPMESQLFYNLGAAESRGLSSGYEQWTMMSWMGRAIYGFKDNRYMLTASLRYDGSSRLAEGHKWVAFPSFALAWRMSDEAFIQKIEAISNLKLRVGYGKTGNSSVNPYQTIGKIGSSRYTWGNVGALGYAPNSLSNKELTWETTDQYNVGLDFGLFNGRVSGSIELYQQKTYDLLMPRVLPEVSGFGSIVQNVGETENKGLEFTLETVNFESKDFRWTTSLQFATNREKIVKLATGLDKDIANMWFVGHPVDTYYDYVNTKYAWGYSKEDMEEMALFNGKGASYKPGDLRFVDLNNDHMIDDDNDREIRGQKMPKWTAGMGNSLQYKDFDFYVFMYGMFGHTIYCDPGSGHAGRMNTRDVSYWTPENTQTSFRKPTKGGADQPHREAYWYHKGDFVRISDITLGYTLPQSLTRRAFLERVRFYAQVQNPFTITSYPNNDPEGSVKAAREGWSNRQLPYSDPSTMRNYIFGVNLTF